jgi:hypothetical protein
MKKILNYISGFTIVLSFVVLAVIGYWKFYPYEPTTFNTEIFNVLNPVVKQGGYVVYEVDACKNMNVKPIVEVWFVDSIQYLSAETFAALPMGCSVTRIERLVPASLPPGIYYLKLKITYPVNPIRNLVIEKNTEKFRVIKSGIIDL